MFTAVSYCPIAGVAGAAYTLSCVSKRPRPSLYAAIGASVLSAVPSTATLLRWHALLVLGYGVRLFGFLLWRQIGQDSGWGEKIASLDKQPRLQRTPVIVSTALFYALLTSPLLFHLQSPSSGLVAFAGVTVAAVGLAVVGDAGAAPLPRPRAWGAAGPAP